MKGLRPLLFQLFVLLTALSFAHSYRSDGGTVFVNEMPTFTLKSSLDGYSPSDRAFKIVNTLTDGSVSLPLTIKPTSKGTWVYAGKTRVVRVTAAEAKAHNLPITELVSQWKRVLETALGLPPIQAPAGPEQLGVGANAFVALVGTEAQFATIKVGNSSVARIERIMGGIKVVGLALGETTVAIHTPTSHAQLLVKVLPSAVDEIPELLAEVRGDPARPSEVQAVIAAAIQAGLKTAKDARIEIISANGRRIPAGSMVSIPVKIRVLAPDTIPYSGTVTVKVKNLGIPKEKKAHRTP
ncbi:MAG: hypothetical protein JNK63_07345 [Chthonomonas sp.]|nr:hypothetical protein [Chthonomonas sp.]